MWLDTVSMPKEYIKKLWSWWCEKKNQSKYFTINLLFIWNECCIECVSDELDKKCEFIFCHHWSERTFGFSPEWEFCANDQLRVWAWYEMDRDPQWKYSLYPRKKSYNTRNDRIKIYENVKLFFVKLHLW